MWVAMKSNSPRRHEDAMSEQDGNHGGTRHWPLAARAWPLATPAVPPDVFLRLTVSKLEPTRGTTPLIATITGWSFGRDWGYGAGGSIGLTLAIVLALWLGGRI